MTKTQAKQQIKKLVEKYEKLEKEGKVKKYNEAQTRNEFIEPLFEALGWDMRNQDHEDEVTTEENISGDRVDLAFRLNNIPVMFLEAKAMKVDLDEWKWAEQAINYSWNKGVDWAVLTDFEGIKVFNATLPPEGPGENRFLTLSYRDYLKDFEKLWWLSKESMEKGVLEEEARKTGLLKEKRSVDEVLFEDLMDWRQKLSNNFAAYNQKVDQDLLDEGVQRLLDRLIFVRTAEDRKIEEKVLIVKLREWEKKGRKGDLMKVLNQVFEDFRKTYDSKLFEEHPFEKWEIESTILGKVIKGLYESKEGYTYDFSAISADVLGGIYEQYLGHILEKAKKSAKVTEKHKKRKSQGIYYTPKFIVDYIVENTLGKKLKEIKKHSKNCLRDVKKLKVLDPACGSGSFLIRAFEVLDEFYEKECGVTGNPMARRMEILTTNIYGVDLDPQAVEIARLNLLLRALKSKGSLPSLEGNIKCGNSLVSEGDPELKPFVWEEEFPDVFKDGGFDVVIGNPPYVSFGLRGSKRYSNELGKYLRENYPNSAEYKLSTYAIFMDRAIQELGEGGYFSFVVPDSFLLGRYFSKLRKFILDTCAIIEVTMFVKDFWGGGVVGRPTIITLKRLSDKKLRGSNKLTAKLASNISEFSNDEYQSAVYGQEYFDRIPYNRFRLFFDESSEKLVKKIENDAISLGRVLSLSSGLIGKGGKERIVSKRKKGNKWLPGLISGAEIDRYFLNYAGNFILYDEKLLHSGFKDADYFKTKILIRQTADSIIATIDSNNFLCLNNLHVGNAISDDLDIRCILALINSKLLNRYYRLVSLETGRTMAQTDIETLEQLPIKKINESKQRGIINLVDRILDLNKKLLKAEEGSEEWKGLKKEIERVDGEIDGEVYKLYGLSEGEIKIVEGGKQK